MISKIVPLKGGTGDRGDVTVFCMRSTSVRGGGREKHAAVSAIGQAALYRVCIWRDVCVFSSRARRRGRAEMTRGRGDDVCAFSRR